MRSNIVVVPDMSAVDLTALIEKDLKITHLGSDYKQWDYFHDADGLEIFGRGRKYEVLVWTPEWKANHFISSAIVRGKFKEFGDFYGHAGAFVCYSRVTECRHSLVTILDEKCCCRIANGDLCVPHYSGFFERGGGELSLEPLGTGWGGGWCFVGFRELA